jgi:DeoR/GlpR family transcriptional regulator of sugar metabolism
MAEMSSRDRRRWREIILLAEHGSLDLDIVRNDPELKKVGSDATFWEDFDELARMGVAKRVLGGLEKAFRPVFEGTYFGINYANQEHQRQREAIANHVATKLVHDYETGVVGHGSSCLETTQQILKSHIGVMVITTNVAVAELAPHESAIIIGGYFERDIWALCGADTENALRSELEKRKPDFGLVGASGISISNGGVVLYCHKPIESNILSTICELIPRLIVVVGHDKLGKGDMVNFFDLRRRSGSDLETILVTTEPRLKTPALRRDALKQLQQLFIDMGKGFSLEIAPRPRS